VSGASRCTRMIMLLSSGANALRLGKRNLALERRTARLTILIDPRKKAVFERVCAEEDATPSQVVRRLLRAYIEERTGKPWKPENTQKDETRKKASAARAARG